MKRERAKPSVRWCASCAREPIDPIFIYIAHGEGRGRALTATVCSTTCAAELEASYPVRLEVAEPLHNRIRLLEVLQARLDSGAMQVRETIRRMNEVEALDESIDFV